MKQTLKPLLIVSLLFALQACSDSKPTQLGISQPSPASPTPAPSPTATPQPAVLAPVPAQFNRTLVGTIDDKHAIEMDLRRNAEELQGTYFYKKNGPRKTLSLSGGIDAAGNVHLTESDEGGKETGTFTGKLVNEMRGDESTLKFTGSWAKTKGAAPLPVTAAERQFDLGGMKIVAKEQKEENKKQKFSIETSYPQLAGGSTPQAENFNKIISDFVTSSVKGFKKNNKDAAAELKAFPDRPGYSMDISYQTLYADPGLISVQFINSDYTGGAHGNYGFTAFNYDLQHGVLLTLADLFQPNSNYLKVISDYCIAQLKKDEVGDAEWIRRGAGPKPENYKDGWNITADGLEITFGPYQVASYAEGPQEIEIPYSALKSIIKPDGPLARFIK